jgi:hypothetical protein
LLDLTPLHSLTDRDKALEISQTIMCSGKEAVKDNSYYKARVHELQRSSMRGINA